MTSTSIKTDTNMLEELDEKIKYYERLALDATPPKVFDVSLSSYWLAADDILDLARSTRLAVPEWILIEKAPKDGTRVLVKGGKHINDGYNQFTADLERVEIAFWCDEFNHWEGDAENHYEPTHFMPIPI